MRSQSISGAPPVYPIGADAARQQLNREHASRALDQMMSQYGMSQTQLSMNSPAPGVANEVERLQQMQQTGEGYITKGFAPQQTTMNVNMPGASGGGAPTGSPTNPMLFSVFGSAAKSPTTFGTSQTGRLPGLLNNNPF